MSDKDNTKNDKYVFIEKVNFLMAEARSDTERVTELARLLEGSDKYDDIVKPLSSKESQEFNSAYIYKAITQFGCGKLRGDKKKRIATIFIMLRLLNEYNLEDPNDTIDAVFGTNTDALIPNQYYKKPGNLDQWRFDIAESLYEAWNKKSTLDLAEVVKDNLDGLNNDLRAMIYSAAGKTPDEKNERINKEKDSISLNGEQAKEFFSRLCENDVSDTECQLITRLDLSSKWIKRIPPEIKRMANLEVLNLSSNTLKELPEEFRQLLRLRELNLSSNSFEEFPSVLIYLPQLRKLDVGGNRIKALPVNIGSLKKLTKLDLYRNEFELIPPQLGDLVGLQNLDVSYNKFQYLPADFFRMKSLQTLDLNTTKLKCLPKEIEQLDHLNTLDISYNAFEEPLPYNAIQKWFARGVLFKSEETSFEHIMSKSGINLFKTVISDFTTRVLLTNDLDKITSDYKLLESL